MILSAGPESDDKEPAQNVTCDDIEDAIRNLDGEILTSVMFGDPQAGIPIALPYMGVSGANGRYFVFATLDDTQFRTLTNPENPEGMVSLVAGGQQIEIDAKQCVNLDLVLKAAQVFFEKREFEPSQSWTN